MTTLDAKTNIEAGTGKSPWRRLWQVPLLLAGLVIFAVGVKSLVRTIKPVSFETHVSDLQGLVAAKQYPKAIEQINTLAEYYKQDNKAAGVLHEIAGDVHYLAQLDQPGYVRANYEAAIDQYHKATLLGVTPTVEMNERWGLSALAIGDAKTAVEKLEEVTKAEPEKIQAHAKPLVKAYLEAGQTVRAMDVLNRLLKQKNLEVDDRVWALTTRIEMTLGTSGGGGGGTPLDRAVEEAKKALVDIPERNPAGKLLTWIGRAEFERGEVDAAQKDLVEARARYVVHTMDDGQAALMLGKIAQLKGSLDEAGQLFQEVITRHAGTSLWAAARMGRAEILAMKDTPTAVMVEDYHYAIGEVTAEDEQHRREPPQMISAGQVRGSLVAQYQRYSQAGKLDDALTFLALQQELKEKETPAMAYRLATTKERRAQQLLEEMGRITGVDGAAAKNRAEKKAEALGLLAGAAEDYRRHSKLTTMEDATSSNSLWKAAQLFDEAGQSEKSMDTYEQFVIQRPRDARVPEGMLAIGQLNQSIGKIDEAIGYYEKNIQRNPKTPAAYTSTVNLALCYMAGGHENFSKAEAALLSLVEGNQDLLPTATEFRVSLFTLGELYFRNQRWSDAILRLEESLTRYPNDRMVPRATYMLAESYRHSAQDISDAMKKDPAIEHRSALDKARQERLRRAENLYGQVIGILDPDTAEPKPLALLDEGYLRSAYMNRSECSFELEDYATAVKQYDQTATRFSQTLTAVEAYVQIVNCFRAMKEPLQASAASERARWILKRVPDDEFGKPPLALSRQYYEDFLKLGKTP